MNGIVRWIIGPEDNILQVANRTGVFLCLDTHQKYVALFTDPFYLKLTKEKFPDLEFELKLEQINQSGMA